MITYVLFCQLKKGKKKKTMIQKSIEFQYHHFTRAEMAAVGNKFRNS